MLLACITDSDRQEIVLLQPTGLIFENYETGVFHRAVEEILTRKRQGRPETGLPSQETGKK